MKQGLSLRASQHLTLTPQLQQSIRLLQLSTLELGQEIEQMLADNPFLEQEEDLSAFDTPVHEMAEPRLTDAGESDWGAADAADGMEAVPELEALADWRGEDDGAWSADEADWGGDVPVQGGADADESDAMALARSQEALPDFLRRQALALRLAPEDRAALHFLIDSLSDDGYLEDPLPALVHGLAGADEAQGEALLHHFTVALRLLQSLEPVGVGARDLAECLRLQLQALQQSAAAGGDKGQVLALALRICQQPMDLLARRDARQLVSFCHATEAQVREAMALIARLEPRPGRRFVQVERNIVVPDVLVMASQGRDGQLRYRVQINPEVMPRLRVHDIYANALKGHKASARDAAHTGLQQRLQEARWFIKNIQQRFDTILRVSRVIVERQKNFFLHGDLAMRPLVLREIADELGMHESTISRVTTAKYMATPRGTYELKYFFGSGLNTESGNHASSTAVRALIKQFVAAENPKKPLSDSRIAELLKEQGIECARRTVAKYREALRIAPTNLRKAL